MEKEIIIEELEKIKKEVLWESNGQYCARISSGKIIDYIDKRIKELKEQ